MLGQWTAAAVIRATVLYFAYSTVFLLGLSRASGVNLNYMLCPPAPLDSMGSRYMLFWAGVGFPGCMACACAMLAVGQAAVWCGTKLGMGQGGDGKKRA